MFTTGFSSGPRPNLSFIFYLRAILAWFWFFMASAIVFCMLPIYWKNNELNFIFAKLLDRVGLPLLGWRVHVENAKGMYLHQPCVYVGNHQSNFDIFVYSTVYPPRTAVIAKQEILHVPFFGLFFVGSGNIVIKRENRQHALAGMEVARDAVVQKKTSIWMFPEGHRNHGKNEMLPFKKGAFRLAIAAQVPVVPMVTSHNKKYLDPSLDPLASKDIQIKILDPIPTKGLTADDVDELMNKVRAQMEVALKAVS